MITKRLIIIITNQNSEKRQVDEYVFYIEKQ